MQGRADKMRGIFIKWNDPACYHGWTDTSNIPQFTTVACTTLGIYRGETKTHVSVSLSDGDNATSGETMIIPKAVIKKRKYVKMPT